MPGAAGCPGAGGGQGSVVLSRPKRRLFPPARMMPVTGAAGIADLPSGLTINERSLRATITRRGLSSAAGPRS